MNKWDYRYMEWARLVSTWSKDPSTKVGAVAVDSNHRVLSTGYNGFPKGVKDLESRYNDRETKYKLIVHAEQNLIYNASKNGVSLENSVVYVTSLPVCHECAKAIIQSGVSKIVMEKHVLNNMERWKDSWKYSELMLREADISIHFIN